MIKIKKQNLTKILITITLLTLSILTPSVSARRTISEGTVIIEEGETVDGFTAFGANIIIKGDVKGEVQAFGANIEVTGNIDGDLKAYGANINIDGTVQGDTEAYGANINIKENANLQGSLKAAGAAANIDGIIGGDAEIAANTLKLGPDSRIKGNLQYEAKTFAKDTGAKVEGTTTIKETRKTTYTSHSTGPKGVIGKIAGAIFKLYWLLVTFAFGAILLLVAPGLTEEIQKRAMEEPITMGATGLLVLFIIPVILIAMIFTIIGIPISMLGWMLFLLLIFTASIYGKYILGMYILIKTEKPSPWKALLLGILIGELLGYIPLIGGILKFLIFIIGLGTLSYTLKVRIRKEKTDATDTVKT